MKSPLLTSLKAGLILQIVLFIGFVTVVLKFHSNVRRANLEGRYVFDIRTWSLH
jgi:hypothetical protein